MLIDFLERASVFARFGSTLEGKCPRGADGHRLAEVLI